MKTINYSNYKDYMGILIDVRNPLEFKEKPTLGAINIYYEKLMYNPTKYLNKNQPYFIICHKGVLSDRVVRHLEFLGYDVTKVLNR